MGKDFQFGLQVLFLTLPWCNSQTMLFSRSSSVTDLCSVVFFRYLPALLLPFSPCFRYQFGFLFMFVSLFLDLEDFSRMRKAYPYIQRITAAVIEDRRRNLALNKPTLGLSAGRGAISSMSSLWMIPQLTLVGFAEAFNTIGQIEFYYKQFPENMRSIAGSSFFLSLAISNYLSGFMVTIVHRSTNWLDQDLNYGRLDYFYLTIAGLGVVNFMYFMVCASWYRTIGTRSQKLQVRLVCM